MSTVKDRILDINTVIGRLDNCIFLGMRTQAFLQALARSLDGIAARASAFAAVFHAARRTVIAGGNNTLVLYNDGGNFSFDAISLKTSNAAAFLCIFL